MTTPSTHYQILVLNHANLKRPIHIVAGTLSYFLWSEAAKSVVVFLTGGSSLPVSESIEQIRELVENLKKGKK